MNDDEWARCAKDLGLTPLEAPAMFVSQPHMSFPARLRERLVSANGPITCAHLLAGTWRGRRCLLEHRQPRRTHHELHLVVEITPSLGLSAYIGPKGTRGLIPRNQAATHDPTVDERFDLEASDEAALASMLRPRDDEDRRLIEMLAADRVVVTDTTVFTWGDAQTRESVTLGDALANPFGSVKVEGQSPAQVAARLDRLVWIAEQMAARRARVPASPAELARHAAWRAAGERHGLSFDPIAATLRAAAAEASIVVGLESRLRAMQVEGSHPPFYTSFVATFAKPLGLGLYVEAAGLFNWLGELVGRDIKVGHEAFDRAFRVRGSPEDAVRRRLAPAAAALADVAAAGWTVVITDSTASLLRPERAETEKDVEAALALALPALRAVARG